MSQYEIEIEPTFVAQMTGHLGKATKTIRGVEWSVDFQVGEVPALSRNGQAFDWTKAHAGVVRFARDAQAVFSQTFGLTD
jgi:hypothetical protein